MEMSEFDLEQAPELNITPLVDIMLVLLAILMVALPAMVYEERISLPKASKQTQIQKQPTLEVIINKDGVIKFKGEEFKLATFADNFILSTHSIDKSETIYIRADKSLKYEDVMYVLKSIKEAGFSKVSLVTDG